MRSGKIHYIVLAHQNAVPLSDYIGRPEMVDLAAEIGVRMCELCLAGQRNKLSVGQYLLGNWLICEDGRLSLPDFTESIIRDEKIVANLREHSDCAMHLKAVEKMSAAVNLASEGRKTLESFAFMLLAPSALKKGLTFQELRVELAISQHITNDAGRGGLEFTNPVAASYLVIRQDYFGSKVKGPQQSLTFAYYGSIKMSRCVSERLVG